MASEPIRLAELSGAAADAVAAAARGEASIVIAGKGQGVARIVPYADELERRLCAVAGRFKSTTPLGVAEVDEAIGEAVGR